MDGHIYKTIQNLCLDRVVNQLVTKKPLADGEIVMEIVMENGLIVLHYISTKPNDGNVKEK